MITGTETNRVDLKIGEVMRYRMVSPAKIHPWKGARALVATSSSKEFARCLAAILTYYNDFIVYKNNKNGIFSLQKCWLTVRIAVYTFVSASVMTKGR